MGVEQRLRIAEGYANLWELTPSILRELISKIGIFEPLNQGGKKRIRMHYNFVGAVDAMYRARMWAKARVGMQVRKRMNQRRRVLELPAAGITIFSFFLSEHVVLSHKLPIIWF